MATAKTTVSELEALRAELEALKAENETLKDEKRAVPMSATRPAPSLADQPKVKLKLFKDAGKYKDDVFVGINGHTFLIKRGVEVEVPESVARVLEDADRQSGLAADYMSDLQDQNVRNPQPGTT